MKVQLNRAVSGNLTLLKISSDWPCDNKTFYKLYQIFITINMYWYNITGFFHILKNINNTEEITATVYIFGSTLAVLVKQFFFRKNYTYLEKILEYFESQMFQPQCSNQIKILKQAIFLGKFVFYYFLSTALVTLMMWFLFPILDKKRRFPSNAWFPYDFLSSPYYEATYLWQAIFICYHALSNVGMDTLFAILMIQIGAQCDLLSDKFKKLGRYTTGDKFFLLLL